MAAAAPIAPLLLHLRAGVGKEDPRRLRERTGRSLTPRPPGPLAWLHGASVGESVSLLPVVNALRTQRPQVSLLVTSGTVASAKILAGRLPERVIHQYVPIDIPQAATAFIDHWRPDLAVFVESEIWPNLILGARAGGASMAIVSARLSPSSLARWRRAPEALKAVFSAFQLVLARDREAAAGLADFGIGVHGLVDLKFGAEPLPFDVGERAEVRGAVGQRPIILAASTHEGEDALIARSYRTAAPPGSGRALLVLVPRHPARAAGIEIGLRRMGFASGRLSQKADPSRLDVLIADELGKLGLWYSLAVIAIVGASLTKSGRGHNPLEPARLSCPIVFGPWVANWPIYHELSRAGAALAVSDPFDLIAAIERAVSQPRSFDAQVAAARRFVQSGDIATEAAIRQICELIEP